MEYIAFLSQKSGDLEKENQRLISDLEQARHYNDFIEQTEVAPLEKKVSKLEKELENAQLSWGRAVQQVSKQKYFYEKRLHELEGSHFDNNDRTSSKGEHSVSWNLSGESESESE